MQYRAEILYRAIGAHSVQDAHGEYILDITTGYIGVNDRHTVQSVIYTGCDIQGIQARHNVIHIG